uniref:SRP40_C domain-containing protein n=1 Tax=Elaeophora elaphi TaxID=1147741 RepID=A0A0R3RJM7_9BILA
STSSSDEGATYSLSAVQKKVPGKVVLTTPSANLKNAAHAKKPESSSDGVSSDDNDDDGHKGLRPSVRGKFQGKTASVTPNGNSKNAASGKKPQSSSDSTSSSDDDDNNTKKSPAISVRGKISKEAVPNVTSVKKLSGSSSNSASSSNDAKKDLQSVVQKKVPRKAVPSGPLVNLKNATLAKKLPGSSDSTSNSDDGEEKCLRPSVRETRGKSAAANSDVKKAVSVSKASASSSESTSGSDDNIDKNMELSTKQGSESLTVLKSERFKNGGESLSKKTSNALTKIREITASSVRKPEITDGLDDSSSDSESEIHKAPAKKLKLQDHQKAMGTIQKKAVDTSSSGSSDNDSNNAVETAIATVLNGELSSTMKGVSRDKSLREAAKKTVTTKALGDKIFANEDTSSSDSNSDNEINKMQVSSVVNVKQSKASQPVVTQSKVKPSSSDSSSISEKVFPEKTMQKQHSNRLGHQQEVIRKQKLVDDSSSDDSSSDDLETDIAKSKIPASKTATISPKHLPQKSAVKLGKLPAERDSETSSDSDSDEAALKLLQPQTATGVQMNSKSVATKDSATSSDSSSDSGVASAKRNVVATFKRADNTSGKAADILDVVSLKEDKKSSGKNANSKEEDKNADVKNKNDDVQNGVGSDQGDMVKGSKKQKRTKVNNEPFHRVKITKDELDDKFRDNSYRTKTYDHWGRKAYEDMKNVQGKGFRHEKTKKKRGSYSGRGTKIDTSSHSIKFGTDSE